ncbi:unnamed protein product, partial [Didymodactylos carnosus]
MTSISSFGEQMTQNIQEAAQRKLDLSTVLEADQHRIFAQLQGLRGFEETPLFFCFMALLSHFSRDSYYLAYRTEDKKPINLYVVLVGDSGSGKTQLIGQMELAKDKVEQVFQSFYIRKMDYGEISASSSSVVKNVNHLGLRKLLALGSCCYMNDEADVFFDPYGVFDVGNSKYNNETCLLLQAFDGLENDNRSTGSTTTRITKARLSILAATTGGKYQKLLFNWSRFAGFEGIHNRMSYLALDGIQAIRPQNIQAFHKEKQMPTLAHVLVVAHLFGTIEYDWRKTDDELKLEAYDSAPFLQNSTTSAFDETQATTASSGTQVESSAWNLAFNLTSDHLQWMLDNKRQPLQIRNIYAKTTTIYPRYCALFQLFRHCVTVLQHLSDDIDFDEGFEKYGRINANFTKNAKIKIHDLFLSSAKQSKTDPTVPVLLIEKESCVAAWQYYEFLFHNALTLFKMPPSPSSSILSGPNLPTSTNERKILEFQFNQFMPGALTGKIPDTNEPSPFHNAPHLVDATISKLIADGIIAKGYFLLDARCRRRQSFMKLPVPLDPKLRDDFETKLARYQVSLRQYEQMYKRYSSPQNHTLSLEAIEYFKTQARFVNEYHKYHELEGVIETYVELGHIVKVACDSETFYDVSPTATVFESETRSPQSKQITLKTKTTSSILKQTSVTEIQLDISPPNDDITSLLQTKSPLLPPSPITLPSTFKDSSEMRNVLQVISSDQSQNDCFNEPPLYSGNLQEESQNTCRSSKEQNEINEISFINAEVADKPRESGSTDMASSDNETNQPIDLDPAPRYVYEHMK